MPSADPSPGIDSAVGHRLSAGCLRGRNPSNSTFNAPNGDGIDIDSSTNAHVHSSIIDAADDALCIKAGADWLGRHVNRPTENVLFENIEVRNGHGLTLGSDCSGGARNITWRHIHMNGRGKIVMLSRFLELPISLTLRASLLQGRPARWTACIPAATASVGARGRRGRIGRLGAGGAAHGATSCVRLGSAFRLLTASAPTAVNSRAAGAQGMTSTATRSRTVSHSAAGTTSPRRRPTPPPLHTSTTSHSRTSA